MKNDKTTSSRRDFLAAGGIGAALVLAAGESAQAATSKKLSKLEKANEKVVNDFCATWPTLDSEKLGGFLADNATFRMIDTSPRIEGKQAIIDGIKAFLASAKSARFEMIRSTVMGNIVINERIDHFDMGERQNAFHVTGFFLVKKGKIVEWQDYMMPKTD